MMTILLLIAVLLLAACGGGDITEGLSGDQLAGEVGCLACHTDRDTSAAPSVVGIWGTDVQLADGRSVTVDDAYVRRSITEPGADVVEGYNPIMPTLPLTDDEVDRLVDWVRSLE
jgi:cytochrome c oxidase subunit 2